MAQGYNSGTNYNPQQGAGQPTPGTTSSSQSTSTADDQTRRLLALTVLTSRAQAIGSGGSYRFRGSATEGRTTGYTGSDQSKTIGQLLDEAYTMSSADVRALQQRLENVGLLQPGKYLAGIFDDKTSSAYVTLLEHASASTQTLDETWKTYENAVAKYGKPGDLTSPRAPLVLQLTSPDDIKTVADNTVPKLIGRKLNANEMASFISAFHNMQIADQQKDYASQTPGGPGGSVVNAPSVQGFAEQQAQQLHPQEYATQQQLGEVNTVEQMIQQGGHS